MTTIEQPDNPADLMEWDDMCVMEVQLRFIVRNKYGVEVFRESKSDHLRPMADRVDAEKIFNAARVSIPGIIREQVKGLIHYVVMEYRRTMHMDSDRQIEALTDEVIQRNLIPTTKE